MGARRSAGDGLTGALSSLCLPAIAPLTPFVCPIGGVRPSAASIGLGSAHPAAAVPAAARTGPAFHAVKVRPTCRNDPN